jgi:hypothetical protein
MSSIKFFLAALIMLSFTFIESSQAQVRRGPRYDPPGRGGPHRPAPMPPRRNEPFPRDSRGQISCSARDNGWEEHWTGHSSCGECLQKHDRCTESCVELRERCEVQGTDYQGRTRIYVALGPDRWSAESEARRQCDWQRDNRSCVTTSCRPENRPVSNRSCR